MHRHFLPPDSNCAGRAAIPSAAVCASVLQGIAPAFDCDAKLYISGVAGRVTNPIHELVADRTVPTQTPRAHEG